jgi:hypothetical protein
MPNSVTFSQVYDYDGNGYTENVRVTEDNKVFIQYMGENGALLKEEELGDLTNKKVENTASKFYANTFDMNGRNLTIINILNANNKYSEVLLYEGTNSSIKGVSKTAHTDWNQ